MNKTIILAIAVLLAPPGALGAEKADIEVMTMNQYLGADLSDIITATTPEDFNNAIIGALQSIAGNNFPERAEALAETIADKNPHLVGLQEVYTFGCTSNPDSVIMDACSLFDAAFNDHLDETLDRLADLEANYDIAATVQNLNIQSVTLPDETVIPGLPVFLIDDGVPEFFVRVSDRDVILARKDVTTSLVSFFCERPSLDGCNFDAFAFVDTLAGRINQERGFAAVDATVNGKHFRFVNTHLELRVPGPGIFAPLVQPAQATQLIATVNFLALPPAPTGNQTLIVGDINSAPTDQTFASVVFPGQSIHPAYLQLANNTDLFGNPFGAPNTDVWNLRSGDPEGLTCCQLANLSNPVSIHDERVDVIFSASIPSKVKANALDDEPSDKTASGLWPSDHSAVTSELSY